MQTHNKPVAYYCHLVEMRHNSKWSSGSPLPPPFPDVFLLKILWHLSVFCLQWIASVTPCSVAL